jgi:hypothetical protein
MMWMDTGNRWLDGHIRALMNFHSEIDSCAGIASPLTTEERETLHRRFKSINTLLCKVAKREAKKRKK